MQNDYTAPPYRLDDLMNGYRITQDTDDFCFGMDCVLLAHFAADDIKKNDEKVCELCCGNGAGSIIMLAERPRFSITAVEIRQKAASLAEYNAAQNGLSDKLTVINCDMRSLNSSYNGGFGAVVVNPPYNAPAEGLSPKTDDAAIARSEVTANLNDVIYTAMRLLKDKGRLYMVHKANRLSEIISVMAKYNMQPKLLRTIHSNENSKANLILICAAKNAGVWLDIAPPIIVYDNNGNYTNQIYKIYNMEEKNGNN